MIDLVDINTVKNDEQVNVFIKKADEALLSLGYTEHSFAHAGKVLDSVEYILSSLGYSQKEIELGKIAAYLHDIGNLINRIDHSQSGALMALNILSRLGMDSEDIATIVGAIGNHDEGTGVPIHPIAAALIIGDKSDVRRSRVRNVNFSLLDIHDRVNFSAISSELRISDDKKLLTLDLKIDTEYGSVMDYFEIFLERMILCKRASECLGLTFCLIINGQTLS